MSQRHSLLSGEDLIVQKCKIYSGVQGFLSLKQWITCSGKERRRIKGHTWYWAASWESSSIPHKVLSSSPFCEFVVFNIHIQKIHCQMSDILLTLTNASSLNLLPLFHYHKSLSKAAWRYLWWTLVFGGWSASIHSNMYFIMLLPGNHEAWLPSKY